METQKRHKIATLGSHTALQILEIPKFSDFFKIKNKLKKERAIIIPHGSFVAYLGLAENKNMKVPYFGNKNVLDWEADRNLQRDWLIKAKIPVPKRFKKGDKIDRAVIVKSFGAAGGHGYFFAKNQKEFDSRIKKYKAKEFIVQEYVIGVPLYIHYFYSPITKKLEILSIDKRYE